MMAGEAQSAAPADADALSGQHYRLLCRAGTHLCAIPIDRVIEIMRMLPIREVAGAPRYVRGLSIIRGAPLPVVDIGRLIGDHAATPERLITIRTDSRTIALAVESVLGISAIAAEALGQLPPLLGDAAETIAAIGTLDSELLFFLRTAQIVPEGLLMALDAQGSAP